MLNVTVMISDSCITGQLPRCHGTKFRPEFTPARTGPIRQAFSASQYCKLAPGYYTGIVTITTATTAIHAPTTTNETTPIAASLIVLPPQQLSVFLSLILKH